MSAVAPTVLCALAMAQPAAADELAGVLRQAGEYVLAYEASFSAIVAEEDYEQWVGDPRYGRLHRRTRADLVFVRLAGEFPWASFRDVFELDHRPVRERDERLVRLLAQGTASARERAAELLRASAEYNIGPVVRTLNLPTLPLLFLHPRNQPRFRFTVGARQTIGGVDSIELVFEETRRPTLVKGPAQSDLPASGRFWIQAGRGSVLHSEAVFVFVGGGGEARFSTEYRREPSLAMWVPVEMRELYRNVEGPKKATFQMPVECRARYRKFRRFTVTTEEKAALPESADPPAEEAGSPPPAEPAPASRPLEEPPPPVSR